MTDGPEDDPFDEVRAAAGDVIGSLRRFVDAAEQVIEDPEAFGRLVAGGKGLIEAFTDGFAGSGSEVDEPDPPEGESA